MSFWEKISTIDRRIIFVFIFLSVALPLIFNFTLPNKVTKEVRETFDFIQALPTGSVVLVSFDHDAATLPEMQPMARAILDHLFSRDLKVVGMAFRAEGAAIGNKALQVEGAKYGKVEGVDYVFLGYRPEITSGVLGIGENIGRLYPKDYRGIPVSDIPLMQKVRSYRDIALVISISDDDTPVYWINYANARYHEPVVPAITAVMATTFYPFLQEKQIVGMVPGLKGAAEYEQLIKKPGDASLGMSAQSMSHLIIVLFVIVGNIGYFMIRSQRKSI
jgi:preprotein translocase subunit YajC